MIERIDRRDLRDRGSINRDLQRRSAIEDLLWMSSTNENYGMLCNTFLGTLYSNCNRALRPRFQTGKDASLQPEPQLDDGYCDNWPRLLACLEVAPAQITPQCSSHTHRATVRCLAPEEVEVSMPVV